MKIHDKAAGPVGVPIELMKHGPDILLEKLVELSNKCLLSFQMTRRKNRREYEYPWSFCLTRRGIR